MKKESRRKRVCILGTAPSMPQAPFEDDEWEMWGVSGLVGHPDCKRMDRIFEIHPWYEVRSMLPLMEGLETIDKPVYMQDANPEIPTSVAFPYDELRKAFYIDAMGDHLYVTNTITWMILLAIYEGYQDFALFGVHMSHEMEYAYQRSSCSWALGIIHGKMLSGEPLTLHIANESALLKAEYEYGFGQPTKLMMKMQQRKEGLQLGVQKVQGQMEELTKQRLRTEGALEEANYWYNFIAGYK